MTPNAEPSLRWCMIALAFLATVINYLDRQALSVTAPLVRAEFHMSNTDYSRVVSAFMLAYTIMNGVSGPLLDRVGTRIGYALCIAWWSISAMLHGLARGLWSLGLCRFLLGMGEAGNWPAAVKVVAEWFPPRERALASGLFNSGSAVGAIVAPPLVAGIVLTIGWRYAFFAVGLSGIAWLGAWWFIYYTPAGEERIERPRAPAVWPLLKRRFVLAFTLSKVFMDPVWYFYIFWFPEYLRSARQFDMASIGKYAWIPFFVAGAGNFAGGWLSAMLLRRGVPLPRARKLSVTAFALLMTSAFPAVLVSNVFLSMGFISVAMLGYTGATANMLAMPADVFEADAVGSVYGLASMGSGFGGMVFALLTGWVVDRYSYVPMFIVFGTLPLICTLILWTLLGPMSPQRLEVKCCSTTS